MRLIQSEFSTATVRKHKRKILQVYSTTAHKSSFFVELRTVVFWETFSTFKFTKVLPDKFQLRYNKGISVTFPCKYRI